jgi:hypothetical protein
VQGVNDVYLFYCKGQRGGRGKWMIIGRTDRWNWEFGEKMEGGERNGTSYRSNCASFLYS